MSVVDAPVPPVTLPDGVPVKFQVPVEGKPFSTMPPVAVVQLGCVSVPIVGGLGVVVEVIVVEAIAEQTPPEVIVTVYTLFVETLITCVIAPVDQRYVGDGALEGVTSAVKFVLPPEQMTLEGVEMFAVIFVPVDTLTTILFVFEQAPEVPLPII